MGLLADIKTFLKKHVKNPLFVTGIAYLVWKILRPNIQQEKIESIRVLKNINGVEIIFDTETKMYFVVKGTKSIPARTLVDAENKAKMMMGEKMKEADYGTYTDAKGNRIVKGDIVMPNPKNASQHKIPLGTKWKIVNLMGDDADIIGVGTDNKGKQYSLGTYNLIRVKNKLEKLHEKYFGGN